jgi:hypothetical protein
MRANTIHIDKYGVQHEIKLLKAGYGGASTELRGSAGFLRFQHDNLNEANPFVTPIQNGRLEFGAWIDSVAGDTVIDELLLSQEGDWIAEWYQNSTLFWKGIVEPDLTVVSEGPYPYEIKLTAKDVTYLGATSYAIGGLPELLISILAKALNSAGYDLPIRTRTSWVCEDTDTAEDFLRQVYVGSNNLKDFAESPATSTEDVPWTNLRVVEEMARAFKLFIRQADGHWLVEQMSAHASPASVLETIYTSAGVYVSDSNVDPTLTANTDISVVLGSTRQTTPAFGFVPSIYEHRTQNFGIRFLASHNVDVFPLTFSQNFIVDGTQNITFTGTVQSRLVSPLPDSSFSEEPYAEVEIRVGNLWYDASLTVADWVSSATRIRIPLLDTTGTGETVRSVGTALRQNFAGTFNIITKIVPTLLTAGDTLTIIIYPSVLPIEATTNYLGLDLDISNNDGEKESKSIKYEVSQSGDYSQGYDDGAVYFGSGPTVYSPGALFFSDTSPTPITNSLITNWNRRGTSPNRILAINIIKEVLDQTRGYRGVLEASIRRTGYSPSKTLEYDGKYWFYIGGTFDGFTGDWTVVFKENALALATDVQVTVIDEPGTNLTSNLLQAISSGRNQSIEAGASDGMRLALEASGSVSQIQVYDRAGYVEVKAGQVLRLVNPVTLSGEQVTASLDRSGDVITIDTKTLTDSYPAGSYVFLSAESLSAGIAIGENAVKIYAEGQSLGRLAQPIDGTVTQIEAHLYTKLVRGMDFLIINQQTGRTYSFNVDQDTAGPGVVTFNVQEQIATARVGDYLVGDNSFQQSQITVSQGEIVLKVDSNNRVALVRLSADNDSGSEIDISAEQVKINDIIFTESVMGGEGRIASDPYTPGSAGWKIDGDGSAEFNDVVVRGSLLGGTDAETYSLTPTDGLRLGIVSLYEAIFDGFGFSTSVNASVDAGAPTATFKAGIILVAYGNHNIGFNPSIDSKFYFKRVAVTKAYIDTDTGQIYTADDTDSTSKDTGAIITEGGIGIEKSAYIGTNLRVLGTTESTSTTTGSTVLSGGLGVAKNVYIGGTINAPKVTITPISDTDSPYAVLSTDTHIAVDNGLSAVTINLPTGTDGRKVTIYDRGGTALLGTITINRASTNTINGLTSITLTSNYQSVTLLFYGGNWTII